jgi:curli biogenesis system outer membrane secretion channel CsgG
MKKFVQTAVLIAGLAGLSACASGDAATYDGRTAGDTYSSALAACEERVKRLEEMNKSCYRK